MVRSFHLVVITALLGSSLACTPRRMTSSSNAIPLRGLGDGLPERGMTPKAGEGPIHYDSLYVWHLASPSGTGRVFRFWPSGYVMESGERRPIRKEDYEIVGDHIGGDIGRFTIVGNEIYIEVYTVREGMGWHFHVFRGELTKDGFVISGDRYRAFLTWPGWYTIGPCRFVRHKVGAMSGTDPSELLVPQ